MATTGSRSDMGSIEDEERKRLEDGQARYESPGGEVAGQVALKCQFRIRNDEAVVAGERP